MYLPKNQYETGYYSNGEFIIKSTAETYIGPYFKTAQGTYFSGKEPNDGPNLEIIYPFQASSFNESTLPDLAIQDYRFTRPNILYSIITKQNKNTIPYTPIPYTPVITETDINNGQFTRYFAKKTNQNIYTEITQNNSILSANSKLYTTFRLQWLIKGDKDYVKESNSKQIAFVEKRLKIVGLGKYLKYNYTQFYQG